MQEVQREMESAQVKQLILQGLQVGTPGTSKNPLIQLQVLASASNNLLLFNGHYKHCVDRVTQVLH